MAYIGCDELFSTAESISWQSSGGSSSRRNEPVSCAVEGENLSSTSIMLIIAVVMYASLVERVGSEDVHPRARPTVTMSEGNQKDRKDSQEGRL